MKNKKVQCPTSGNFLAGITIDDLSLYRDVIMVQDRIWAPQSIRFAFFNNLHLGHRGVNMMMRLATRSVYWSGMHKDITDFFNECYECNHNMRKNQKLPDLPEDETTRPYECISIDIFETPKKEHALAIIDRHTGYVWCKKTGDKNTGTAREILHILKELFGPAFYWIDRFKTDHGSNIVGGAIEEFSKQLGIWQDKSSAYHPAGNRCVENAVGRIKRAIGTNKIEDAIDDLSALNMSSPYNNKTLSPVEELYGRVAPVNGIPRPHYLDKDLISRDLLTERLQRAEQTGSNPELKKFSPEDKHEPTQEENDLSADWVEKINGTVDESNVLTCGDRVYYIDHKKAVKGSGRWRTGIIIRRKAEYKYAAGVQASKGYDIYDVENCTTVTRTRDDIRRYKYTKIERELLQTAHDHLDAMRKEFMKNDRFRTGDGEKPVEFEMSDYDQALEDTPYRAEMDKEQEEESQQPTEPIRPHLPQIKQEPTEDEPSPATETSDPATAKKSKCSREQDKLRTTLNGSYWSCPESLESHGRRSLRVTNTEMENREIWDNVIHLDKHPSPSGELN